MNEEAVQKLIESVGAIAELSVAHYNACVNAGVSSDVAVQLTTGFIKTSLHITMLMRSMDPDKDDED